MSVNGSQLPVEEHYGTFAHQEVGRSPRQIPLAVNLELLGSVQQSVCQEYGISAGLVSIAHLGAGIPWVIRANMR
jgi:hypothetical protein